MLLKKTKYLIVLLLIITSIGAYAERPGWPIDMKDDIFSSPLLADINGDGKLEIIVCGSGSRAADKNGSVHVWDCDGRPMPGWPRKVEGRIMGSSPAGGKTGAKYQIIVCTEKGLIYAWHQDGTPVKGWPVSLPGGIASTPILKDLDSDGQSEIIAGCLDGKVYIIKDSGHPLVGWPRDTGSPVTGIAAADIDGDGSPEIIACSKNNRVHIWNKQGQLLTGWPRENLSYMSPAIGKIDPRSKGLEMVFTGEKQINILHCDGTSLAGWPKEIPHPGPPALGDIDNDGSLEIIASSNPKKQRSSVYAWHMDGALVKGWPVEPGGAAGYVIADIPVLYDLDGDGTLEVIVAHTCYSIHAWHFDGIRVKNFPIRDIGMQYYSPSIADLDDNGRLELVFGGVSSVLKVHVFQLPFAYR
jgi:hypothetical protein